MQIGEQAQRLRNRLEFCLNIFVMPAERMQSIELMPKTQKRAVGNSEQRALQSGEDGEFIIGPFNGRERSTQSLDLFTAVKRFRAEQQARHFTGFQSLHVDACPRAA